MTKQSSDSYQSRFTNYQYGFDGVDPPTSSTTGFSHATDATSFFDGVPNPRWRSQVRRGVQAGTPASGTKKRYQVADFNAKQSFRWTTFGHQFQHYRFLNSFGKLEYDNPFLSVNPSLAVQTRVLNRAIAKFIDSADSARSSFELGQDLGEWKETLHTLIHPMDSMRKLTLNYFTSLKKAKRRFRDNNSLRRALSDTYLEYRFGWRPLAMDVADAYEGLTSRMRMKSSQVVSASASEGYSGSNAGTSYNVSPISIIGNVKRTSYYSVRFKGSVSLNLDNGKLPVRQVLQLDLPHFIPTVWDLLPYSFVVDYFANVGDIIKAYSFPTSSLAWVIRTTRTVSTSDFTARMDDPVEPAFPHDDWKVDESTFNGGNARFQVIDFQRNNYDPNALIPSLGISIPLSSRPWENIAALVSSNIKSLVPFKR